MLSENTILSKAMDTLRRRLPPGWSAGLTREVELEPACADGMVRVTAPDGRSCELVAEVKHRLDPRRALELAAQTREISNGWPPLAVAPWMSRRTRERLVHDGMNFIDLTGNIRLVLSEPGLFIEASGATHDPWPETSKVTLRGTKAAALVRALCRCRPPIAVKDLAAAADTTSGYVSKLLTMLDEQAALHRTPGGQVSDVDLRRLIAQWAEDAPLEDRVATTSCIEPRGLTSLQTKLRKADQRYVVTGSLAAVRRAPVAAPRVVSVYVDDPESFAKSMDLRPADSGANVLLLVPDDEGVFAGTWEEEGVRYAAFPQIAADLLSGLGRGPAEAEALLDWMTSNPEVWRG